MTFASSLAGVSAAHSHVTFALMQASDGARVHALQAQVFGPGRYARTAFRLREKAAPLLQLSWVAQDHGTLVGAVSMSRIAVGQTPGVLLGPLAVLAEKRDLGIGKTLLFKAVESAFQAGEPFVLLVGDLPYYASAGFQVVPFGSMAMPGPVDPSRLLIARHPDQPAPPAGAVRGLSDNV